MTFKCTEVNDTLFLVADMTYVCFEGEHLVWTVVAVAAIVVYVVGIPLLLLVLLWISQRNGTLHFPAIEFDANVKIEPEAVIAAVHRVNAYLRNRVAYGSLYDQYEPSFFWFEFGCTMRKMILTGALVLFGAGTTAQVVTALAVCILWLTLIANLKPFGDDVDDRLAQVEAIQILFTLLIGLVLQLQAATQDGSREEEDALGVMLIILNLAVIALAFVQQPIFLKIASRVSEVIARIKERAASHKKNKKGTPDAADDAVQVGIEMQSNPSYAAGPTGLHVRAAKGTAASKIEMRANPLVPATRTNAHQPGSLVIAGAATKVTMRGNPLVATAGAAAIQPRVETTDTDRAEDARVVGVDIAQLRAEIAQLRAENEQLKEAQPGAVVELDENWFYTDHDDVQHGPFTLVKLKRWFDGGHFEASKLICNGREGDLVELGSVVHVEDMAAEETRVGEDGFPYNKAAFVAHYGGTDEWDAAGN